ncbi:MAG: DUF4381 family protein [Sulfurovum sp.]|nr:DUF4381 family protein [Sulfurovum sp.]
MSEEMNATIIAQASLDNLHDIIVPEPIGLFPLAPGWWVLLFLLLTLLFHFAWQYYLVYKKTQYKREALEELSVLKTKDKTQTLALLELAKRTAIAAYSRERIATLNDDAWWDFMQEESKVHVDLSLRKALSSFLYHEKVLNESEYLSLMAVVEKWIQTHKGRLDD